MSQWRYLTVVEVRRKLESRGHFEARFLPRVSMVTQHWSPCQTKPDYSSVRPKERDNPCLGLISSCF